MYAAVFWLNDSVEALAAELAIPGIAARSTAIDPAMVPTLCRIFMVTPSLRHPEQHDQITVGKSGKSTQFTHHC
jgi:hypothetical protein